MQQEVTTDSTFGKLKQMVEARFKTMTAGSYIPLVVEYTRDDIWAAYHNAFETEEWKQNNDCNCCNSFIRSAGGMVIIDPATNALSTLWSDHDMEALPQEYREPVKALDAYIRSLPIRGLWLHNEDNVGTDRNLDKKRDVIWTHFSGGVPIECRISRSTSKKNSDARANKDVLKRSLQELKLADTETVLELIAQGTLYRGNEYKYSLEVFLAVQKAFAELSSMDEAYVERWLWAESLKLGPAISKIRNTSIGTLLVDLAEGKDLDRAVSSYEKVVAPTNYKRPKALVTPRMIEQAKEKLGELGFLSALHRRRLDSRDLTAADARFVYRPTKATKDVFDQMADEAPVDQKTLSKVEEISVDKFLEEVVPKAKGLRVLFERQHLGNLVSLTGPDDAEAPSLFQWDNSYGWSYTGGVADSIKERVKKAGGRVDNVWLRCSLSWFNHDDLDLHLLCPGGERVHFGQKKWPSIGMELDVDMNVTTPCRDAVENIYMKEQPAPGRYRFLVNNYTKRETNDSGFEVEIEHNGDVRSYGSHTSPNNHAYSEEMAFNVDKDGNVTFEDCRLTTAASGMTKWGLKTGSWHQVKALTTSPNHWTRPTGNKHLFFLLEGCVSDEKTRAFYNEFLCKELAEHRKVTEVLASKIEVAPAEGAELSGLGFSDTQRNHLFVEVEGNFKRTLKVLF